MNANELADYLEKAFYADEDISKAANMLRQQQAVIEALKAEIKQWEEWKKSLNGWSKK
jgi:hypothetical protein